jgi:hypothetical protein
MNDLHIRQLIILETLARAEQAATLAASARRDPDRRTKEVIAACHRLIEADRFGWRKHHDPADWRLIINY